MIIIADTSALVALSTCKALYLLEKLFSKVAVSQSVFDECVVNNKSQSEELQKYLKNRINPIKRDSYLNLP